MIKIKVKTSAFITIHLDCDNSFKLCYFVFNLYTFSFIALHEHYCPFLNYMPSLIVLRIEAKVLSEPLSSFIN